MTIELRRPERDEIILADNMDVLPELAAETFQLIYIDPPFNTGKAQSRKTLHTAEDKDGDRTGFGGRRYKTTLLGESSYLDTFDDYLSFLEPRLRQARRLLTRTGTFYFHIDYREAHYCKLLLDEIFGRECFLNELIWSYDYGARSKRWRDPVLRSTDCESRVVVARGTLGAWPDGSPVARRARGRAERWAIRPRVSRGRGRGAVGGERGRRAHPKRRMGAALVVVLAPIVDEHPGFGDARELLAVEQLVSDAGVEGLHERVLPRTAGLDEDAAGGTEATPVTQRVRRQLRSVVHAHEPRRAPAPGHERVEASDERVGVDRPGGVHDQRLASVLIDDVDQPDRPAI